MCVVAWTITIAVKRQARDMTMFTVFQNRFKPQSQGKDPMTTSIGDSYIPDASPPGRWHFNWILPALLQPRQTFERIVTLDRGLASTPLLLLVLAALGAALLSGSIKEAAMAAGQQQLPPGFEFYPPEMQAQFQQALSATSGPVFVYVLPAAMAVLGAVISWLLVGWLLHLLLTLMGGRSSSRQTLNVVAWASLPFVVRHLVRIGAMLSSEQLIAYPGLSGFVTGQTGNSAIFAAALLGLVDIYLLWHVALLVLGLNAGDHLARIKVWMAVLLTIVLVLLARTLPPLVAAQFSDLTIIRPFF